LKPGEEAGEVAIQIKEWMEEIQYGDKDHEWR
jgi:branched-chain amino acid aminotransferase